MESTRHLCVGYRCETSRRAEQEKRQLRSKLVDASKSCTDESGGENPLEDRVHFRVLFLNIDSTKMVNIEIVASCRAKDSKRRHTISETGGTRLCH